MRWNAGFLTLAVAVLTLAGCAQQVFITREDYDAFHRRNELPQGVESNPALGVEPLTRRLPAPSHVDSLDREPLYLTLNECIARNLENGVIGITSTRQPGQISDDLQSTGNGPGSPYPFLGTDYLRVLTLNPAIVNTFIETALARFDAVWVNSATWGVTDAPIQGFNSFSNGDNGALLSSIVKPTGNGGLFGITFNTNYQNLNTPPRNFPILNPAYTPQVSLNFEQPLWKDSGTAINQLLGQHPGAGPGSLLPGAVQGGLSRHIGAAVGPQQAGILVTRIRFDQSRAELERNVSYALLNTEVAYWNLYGAYVNLYSAEQALRQSYEAWRISKAKYDAGAAKITDFAQTRGQYEQFRGDRLQAVSNILEAERILRRLMGMPAEDGKRILPADVPTLAPYFPNWDVALEEALTLRPELIEARAELKSLQFDLMVQRNGLKPDLRLVSQYLVQGLGNRLDGNGSVFDQSNAVFRSNNALRSMASGHFDSWNIGLNLFVPLGYRSESAAVRRAELALTQGYLAVKNEEDKATSFLVKAYRDVIFFYNLINSRHSQRLAFAQQVEARFQEFVAGKTTADFLLEAQRQWANALSTEYQAIVSYNNSLATFQFAKGTILQHDNVQVSEGPLPMCVQVRAVEHERERAKAILLRERALLVPHPAVSPENGCPGLPQLPEGTAPSLPALFEGAGPAPTQGLPNLPPPMPPPSRSSLPPLSSVPPLTASPLPPPPPPAALISSDGLDTGSGLRK